MSKVTSKYQVSIPKRLAEQLKIAPGDEIEWSVAGEELRIGRAAGERALTMEERLAMFDAATARQNARNRRRKAAAASDRGWTREELYERGRTR